jgi:ribosomal protein S18 acetylase RimI-like enzyme
VAEVDGEAAGMLMGEAEWLPNPMSLWQKRAVIQAVWVEPEHRRQGIAKRLVATFEEALAPYNIPYCDMAYAPGNEAAQRFWERLGFRAAEIHGRKLYVAEGDSPEDAARGS